MRLSYLFGLIIIVSINFQAVFAESGLKVTGKISQLEISEENKTTKLSFHITLTFTNTGKVPLLIFTSDSSVRSILREMYGSIPIEKGDSRLYALYTLPSIGVNEETRKIQKLLNAKEPLEELIKTIGIGENLSFETKEWFYIGKEKDVYDNLGNHLWSEIKDAKSLSLRLGYRIWSLDFEPRSVNRDKRPFGKKLQKRWKKYGYLWLDDIVSEPIPLDLSSAIVKTDSN